MNIVNIIENAPQEDGPWYVWGCYGKPVSKRDMRGLPRPPFKSFPTQQEAQAWLDERRKK